MPTIVHFDLPADEPERAKKFYQEYPALVEKSSNNISGLAGRTLDKLSKKNAEATERAKEICDGFVCLAKEKEHQFQNWYDGPYR